MLIGRLGNISEAKRRMELNPSSSPACNQPYRAGLKGKEFKKK